MNIFSNRNLSHELPQVFGNSTEHLTSGQEKKMVRKVKWALWDPIFVITPIMVFQLKSE